MNPISKKSEEHNGIDIVNNKGTEIVAVAKGIVTEVYNSPSYGKVLKYQLEDNADISVLYAHNNDILVKVGDIIEQGEAVSTMGDTGYTTGSHLHYVIYVENQEIDPIEYINLPYTEEVVQEYIDRGDKIDKS